jgi:putative selenate reductase
MSDRFSPIPVERLLQWILKEEETGHIFGIPRDIFHRPKAKAPYSFQRFGQLLETPLGVAAGPHSQMAQNIIAAWLCGGRYIELKTIQTLDELDVSKPCIDMEDEGYNCEWSQELKIHQSYDEYLNAWIIIHILRHKFGWKNSEDLGCIFNMSVGYNLEGILEENVQWFFRKMADCSEEKASKIEAIAKFYPEVREIEIPDCMSDNITLSTMHGCPPDEIEKIAMYLVKEKKLHTTIKLNPTLIGPEDLRGILNGKLGFPTQVPDEAFGHDLKYPDGLNIIRNVKAAADEVGVCFSLKLTNTLENNNIRSVFPENETMMYMSGRALHPVSINLARKLQNEFNGTLDISFSAGADCFNICDILCCGLKPVTMSSDLLKPGGYGRMNQYVDKIAAGMAEAGASSYDQWILKKGKGADVQAAALQYLNQYADAIVNDPRFHKDNHTGTTVKTARELTAFDCIKAPCIETCPSDQEIPKYLYYAAIGDDEKAFEVILKSNPFPNVCGMVCDHKCQSKCTRSNYDNSLLIREIKRFVAERAQDKVKLKPAPANGKKVAVIGAGPSGLSCAYFLALAGFEVNVFESKDIPGGMIGDAIPHFRLSTEAINKDVERIQALGVKIHYNHPVDKDSFAKMRNQNDYLYLAVGAQKAKPSRLEGDTAEGVLDFLSFLARVKRGMKVELGAKVAVIGGGNSAMDVARTAFRLVGESGKVTVVYRRTKDQMPADRDEVHALLQEGIEILELTSPKAIVSENGKVTGLECIKMQLGEKDSSGRAKPVAIEGSSHVIPFDSIIPAIGQDIVLDFVGEELKIDETTGATQLEGVYVGGDANQGPATVIQAIADGKYAASNIRIAAFGADNADPIDCKKVLTTLEHEKQRATRIFGEQLPETGADERRTFQLVHPTLAEEIARKEAARCLYCDDFCSICVTVCPNRANVRYQTQKQDYPVFRIINGEIDQLASMRIAQGEQVLNVGDFCNECGNCTTFCPTSGAPYRDKPKFYLTKESFNAEKNGYYLETGALTARVDGNVEKLAKSEEGYIYDTEQIKAVLDEKLSLVSFELKGSGKDVNLSHATKMGVLLKSLDGVSFAADVQ